MTATLADLRNILSTLAEDTDDSLSWDALADWGEENHCGHWRGLIGEGVPHLVVWEAYMLSAPTKQGSNQIEAMQFHLGYAEPGYDNPIPVTGNWNTITQYVDGQYITLDDSPDRLGKMLDDLGCSLEWEDEWSSCSGCGLLLRTSPDSMSWEPSYDIGDGEILCQDCLDS